MKQQLEQGIRYPRVVKDPLFFRDPKSGAYQPIDATVYRRILEGSIRL
jgi:fatty-acyl-CoA synthase